MKDDVIAQRYAEGFFSLAREVLGLERTLEELQSLKSILRDNPELKMFLQSPIISYAQKAELIEKVFQFQFSLELCHFLCLLADKRRSELLGDIIDYLWIKYARQAQINTILQVSSPLNLEILQSIKEKLEKKMQHRLKLFVHLDTELLGGIRAKIGNTLIDGSIDGSLIELKEKLLHLKVN